MDYRALYLTCVGGFVMALMCLIGGVALMGPVDRVASVQFGLICGPWMFLGMLAGQTARVLRAYAERIDQLEQRLRQQGTGF
jgi:hypothetical protein